MKSDLVHSKKVQAGPQVQWLKANLKTAGAEEPNFEQAKRRTLMEPAILHRLESEVKETVATGVVVPRAKKRSFGVLDLWAIRRSRRTVYGRKQPNIVNGFGY